MLFFLPAKMDIQSTYQLTELIRNAFRHKGVDLNLPYASQCVYGSVGLTQCNTIPEELENYLKRLFWTYGFLGPEYEAFANGDAADECIETFVCSVLKDPTTFDMRVLELYRCIGELKYKEANIQSVDVYLPANSAYYYGEIPGHIEVRATTAWPENFINATIRVCLDEAETNCQRFTTSDFPVKATSGETPGTSEWIFFFDTGYFVTTENQIQSLTFWYQVENPRNNIISARADADTTVGTGDVTYHTQ